MVQGMHWPALPSVTVGVQCKRSFYKSSVHNDDMMCCVLACLGLLVAVAQAHSSGLHCWPGWVPHWNVFGMQDC